ncbi:IclR family transcriptional regulator [Streptomyces sp. NPDC050548]|uniref:IclR family transcriptional regulator n=1 Tax=Streptomyces sp. NPDC050548 TaxID=3365629 RepID=UPI0037938DCA
MPGPIQSLSRGAALLRLLATGEGRLGPSEAAASLGLPKGTVYGILRTLRQEGLVEQDPVSGKYGLGAELARLGGRYLQTHELRAHALAWADDLARGTGEAVHVGVPHRSGVLIVHHVFRPDNTPQVLETGTVVPLGGTALGAVLGAYAANSPAPHASSPPLADSPEAVRDRGWACVPGPAGDGTASIAVPIRDRRRGAVAAVSVTGAADRVCADGPVRASLVSAARTCARSISRSLGDTDRP